MNMTTALIASATFIVGFAVGIAFCWATIRRLRKQVKQLREGAVRKNIFWSVTRFLFVTTQVCALLWVSVSYGIAIYSTVVLMQPFPVVELSTQAIVTLLGMTGMKVLENIFEHNDGAVFGKSKREEPPPPENGGEEGIE